MTTVQEIYVGREAVKEADRHYIMYSHEDKALGAKRRYFNTRKEAIKGLLALKEAEHTYYFNAKYDPSL